MIYYIITFFAVLFVVYMVYLILKYPAEIKHRYDGYKECMIEYYAQKWGLDVNEVEQLKKRVDSELLLKISKRIYELHNLKEGLLNKQLGETKTIKENHGTPTDMTININYESTNT